MMIRKLWLWVLGLGLILGLTAQRAEAKFGVNWNKSLEFGSAEPTYQSFSSKATYRKDRMVIPTETRKDRFGDWDKTVLGVKEGEMPDRGKSTGSADFRYTMNIPFLGPSLFSWTRYNRSGEIIGYHGFAWTLGYYSKRYFDSPSIDQWNPYWHWGTAYIIIPYIGIGTEYMTDKVSFEIGTFYIIPYVGVTFHFN